MKNKSGNTAYGAASFRLMEQYEADDKRLFDDPVVYHLTNSFTRFLIKYRSIRNLFIKMSEKILPGIFGGQICRTKYIDDKTIEIKNEVEQILLLGAGLDTRAYRLKGIGHINIFEIDLPNVQETKKRKLKNYLGEFPPNVTFIPIDFNNEKLEDKLNSSPYDITKPTLVIFEAVTQYLNKSAAEYVFKFISSLANNSYFIFTYVIKDVIDRKSPAYNKIMDWSERKNSPFKYGIDPSEIKSLLAGYNIEMIEDAGTDYYQTNYLKPINRDIPVSEIERINFSKVVK